jgi:hypothetical protein
MRMKKKNKVLEKPQTQIHITFGFVVIQTCAVQMKANVATNAKVKKTI